MACQHLDLSAENGGKTEAVQTLSQQSASNAPMTTRVCDYFLEANEPVSPRRTFGRAGKNYSCSVDTTNSIV